MTEPLIQPSAETLLSSFLNEFKPIPKGPRSKGKPAGKSLPKNAVPLPVAHTYAKQRTGYAIWKATARQLTIGTHICNCCGAKTSYVKSEHYLLENGLAHATWLRAEGYGIDAPEDLPITFLDETPTYVPACPSCRNSTLDDLESLFHPRQQSLPL